MSGLMDDFQTAPWMRPRLWRRLLMSLLGAGLAQNRSA